MAEVLKQPSAGRSWICQGPDVHKPFRELPFFTFLKIFRSIFLEVKTVKNFESKLDQKLQSHWRLAIPRVDRVPGKWLRRPNNNGCYEDSRQYHIKQWDWQEKIFHSIITPTICFLLVVTIHSWRYLRITGTRIVIIWMAWIWTP